MDASELIAMVYALCWLGVAGEPAAPLVGSDSLQIVAAQFNIGLTPASILGIVLALAGAGLYFLRSIRPELSRDHDIFFAAVGLLCGLILLSQGWRLDPILQFSQFLLAGSTGFFAYESIRLRGVATEQAKRNAPIVDEDRPVSRVYRAELDDLEPLDEKRLNTRRIRGSRDSSSQPDDYWDNYVEEPRRRPPLRSATERDPRETASRPRKRRPRPQSSSLDPYGDAGAAYSDAGAASAEPRKSSGRSAASGSDSRTASSMSKKTKRQRPQPVEDSEGEPKLRRKPRPPVEDAATADQPPVTSRRPPKGDALPQDNYVDYQPINYSDEEVEADNSANFD